MSSPLPRGLALFLALLVAVTAASVPVVAGAADPPELDVSSRAGEPTSLPAKGKQPVEFADDSLLVRLAERAQPGGLGLESHDLESRGRVQGTGFVEVAVGGEAVLDVRARLEDDATVEVVEPDYWRRAVGVPDDPDFAYQTNLQAARFPEAWDVVPNARDQVVAVVDSGVDLDHPELFDQILPGWDFVGDDPHPQDEFGHGTAVAGVVAATAGNGRGIAGAGYRTALLPVRVLDATGMGRDSDIAAGIVWAVDKGATVIVLSLAGPAPSEVLAEAVTYAVERDVVVVAAAGNHGGPEPMYPAALPDVVAVGATGADDRLTAFSAHGPWVDLAAVGVDIRSTALAAGPDDRYHWFTGTSLAAPLVAGAAALVQAQHGTWTAPQVVDRLRHTARDAGPIGLDDGYGFGLLDAYAAVGGQQRSPADPATGDEHEPNPLLGHASTITGAVTATIAPEGDVDWYAIDVPERRWLTVTVTPPGTSTQVRNAMDPVVDVFAPDHTELASHDAAGPGQAETLAVEATTPGRYRIRVSNYSYSISPGEYRLDVIPTTDPPIVFSPYVNYPIGSWPESTAIGDVTGDGRADVLLSTGYYFDPDNDWSLFEFAQGDDGTFGPPIQHRTSARGSMSVVTGDADGDGDTDAVVATNAGLELFTQDGGALHGPEVVPLEGGAGQVEIGDLDGDGRPELAALTSSGVIGLTRAADGWRQSVLSASTGAELELGDVSGDGRVDLVLSGARSCVDIGCIPGVLVLVQQPDTSFTPVFHASVHPYGSQTAGLALGDVNGDGRTDVSVTLGGNRPNSMLNTFYQRADGTLGEPLVTPVYDIPQPLEAGDVNGDGRTDLVTAHGGWTSLGVLAQEQDGTLGAELRFPAPYASHYRLTSLSLGDLDGVAGLDVALADYNHGLVVFRQARAVASGDRPWLRSSHPLTGATGVLVDVVPRVDLARLVDTTSIQPHTVQLLDGRTGRAIPSTLAYDPAERRLSIRPGERLAEGRPYQVRINGLRHADAEMREPGVIRFRTVDPPPPTPPPPPPPPPPQEEEDGYWMLGSRGTVYGFGTARVLGNADVAPMEAVDIEAAPDGRGYWIVDGSGAVFAFGSAPWLGGIPANSLEADESVTSLSRTPSGQGYWIFTSRGRAVAHGDARFYGDMHQVRLNGPVLDSVPTPSGEGYYMVASDGGIFAFGDAVFRGSMGAVRLNAAVQSLVPDADGVGYWLVASDGGIFSFDATFHGSMGAVRLNRPVTGMVGFDDGYLMVASDGGIFAFGDAPFLGSLGAHPPNHPITAVAAAP